MKSLIATILPAALALSFAVLGTGCESKERQMRREEAARAAERREAERERIREERANFGRRQAAPPAAAQAPATPPAEPVDFSDVSERARSRKPTFSDPRQEEMYRVWVNIDYPTRRLSDAEYAIILAIGQSQEALDKAVAEREAAIAELQEARFQEEQQAAYEAQLRRVQAEAELRARIQLEQELQQAAAAQNEPTGDDGSSSPESEQAFPRSYD